MLRNDVPRPSPSPSKRRRLCSDVVESNHLLHEAHFPSRTADPAIAACGTLQTSEDLRRDVHQQGHKTTIASRTDHEQYSSSATGLPSFTVQTFAEDRLVCFGTICGIPITPASSDLFPRTLPRTCYLDLHDSVLSVYNEGVVLASVDSSSEKFCLSSLQDEKDMILQICPAKKDPQHGFGHASQKKQHPLHVSVILYGPFELFDDVGDLCQDYQCYLQEPTDCDRNVPYRNPHTIAGSDENVPWTFSLHLPEDSVVELQSPNDLFAGLQTDIAFVESRQPAALKTTLYRHQLQALTFMHSREKGWNLNESDKDLWSYSNDPVYGHVFQNNVTGQVQLHAPAQCRGGLLCDDMGLGKTLEAIALIVSDDVSQPAFQNPYDICDVKTTLLIVPSSLIEQWSNQLTQHLHKDDPTVVRWRKHHGSQRVADLNEIAGETIILTSYQTLVTEYRKQAHVASILLSTKWYRIVLDEAHLIRNRHTATAKAVCSIEATRRWAVTGTPIQNRLSDFATLLEFLRVYPYCDRQVFEEDFIHQWKSGNDNLALERFKSLFKYLAIRRPRSSIKLPHRQDQVYPLKFAEEELSQYRKLESPIVEMLEDALHGHHGQQNLYMNALVKINALRKFCNLGINGINNNDAGHNGRAALLDDLLSSGSAACVICETNVTQTTTIEDSALSILAFLSDCMQLMCNTCSSNKPEQRSSFSCKEHPSCNFEPVSNESERGSKPGALIRSSTKTDVLVRELLDHQQEKSVVFSAWTSTLDLIQQVLDTTGIVYVRISGAVSPKQRAKVLEDFNIDPKIRCILITIACGAEGLNLTAASRVYLMEPQWNPNIEEQALARVHRLGQTRPVTTTRFIMKNSIKDHVANVQARKRHLVDLLQSQQKGSVGKNDNDRLQHLRDLLS